MAHMQSYVAVEPLLTPRDKHKRGAFMLIFTNQ